MRLPPLQSTKRIQIEDVACRFKRAFEPKTNLSFKILGCAILKDRDARWATFLRNRKPATKMGMGRGFLLIALLAAVVSFAVASRSPVEVCL